MFRKLSLAADPNILANQLLQQPHLMPISFTALPLVHPSLHASTSVTKLQLTGIPRSKQQWKQLQWTLRYTLRYLGVTITSKSYMFGDDRSIVTSATLPHSTLSKKHIILAFHRVREAIAAKIIDFHRIQSEYNLSDMLSKHWEHINIFPMILKLLITSGPIALITRSATEETPKSSK